MNTYSLESFINFCDDMMISEEASLNYKVMRAVQTNSFALKMQYNEQKKICEEKFKDAKSTGDMEEFISWLNKMKNRMQKKINGKEIKNKKSLHKFIELYDSYTKKAQS